MLALGRLNARHLTLEAYRRSGLLSAISGHSLGPHQDYCGSTRSRILPRFAALIRSRGVV
jgi:hypothetical protein